MVDMTILTKHIITVSKLARIIDSSDICRRRHCYKVERHSLLVAQRIGLSSGEIRLIKIASMLHDVGKIGIDLAIIKKPAKLTTEEWAQVKRHPEIGANIVGQLGFFGEASNIIKYHHSRFNGGGYPDASLSGGRIPVGSRIIAVTDAFDAMTNDRPYRKAMAKGAAFAELERCSGEQFDPKIVDAFLDIV
jgi:putative nucleotidyltransferase with HDIG domain